MTNNKRVLFGTDGVRDVANLQGGNMTADFALKLGRAFILFLKQHKNLNNIKIAAGLDTRKSGAMLEGALKAGMLSAGADVCSLGVIPTPGVSFPVKHLKADAGAVISASHNPAEYNGIKFLDANGCKLSDQDELEIEQIYFNLNNYNYNFNLTGDLVGRDYFMPELAKDYAAHLAKILNNNLNLKFKIAFDCANGAASAVIPELVKLTNINHAITGASPDGLNINKNSGVMSMSNLINFINKTKADIGFAFDGDADRVLIADANGRIIDGDIILWTLAKWLKAKNLLKNGLVVTVMSNMAIEEHLQHEDIKVFRCPVGDRYVLDTMRKNNAGLGGEQSGHIIADAFTSTGDGACTAMLFLNALHDLNLDINNLTENFGRYPQKLSNLKLSSRELLNNNLDAINKIGHDADLEIKNLSNNQSRVFIRPSGTEPLLRILVEAKNLKLVDEFSQKLILKLQSMC